MRKYLVKDVFSLKNDFPNTLTKDTLKETITFLDERETELREVKPGLPHISYVKKRESPTGHCSYSYIVRILSDKLQERMELRRNITADDYSYRRNALKSKDHHDLVKLLTVFVYENAIFNMETMLFDGKKLRMLRAMSYSEGDLSLAPPFIPVEGEITCKVL